MPKITQRQLLAAMIFVLAITPAWGNSVTSSSGFSLGQNGNLNTSNPIANPSNLPYMRLASWDVGSLPSGMSSSKKDLYSIATVVARFDVVMLQSNMPSAPLSSLISTLGSLTGANWNYSAVPAKKLAAGTPRLAIIWREDRVRGVEAGPGYPNLHEQPRPISLELEFKGHRFWLVDFKRSSQIESAKFNRRLHELARYVAGIVRRYPGVPVILGGGFGAGPQTGMFKALSGFLVPAVASGGSIINPSDGTFASPLADDLWTNIGFPYRAGLLPTSHLLGVSAMTVDQTVSEHAPVFAIIHFP